MTMHMNNPTFVAEVEAQLALAGKSAARLCRRADIAQSTWHRWKMDGVTPRGATRDRVLQALREMGVDYQDAPADTASAGE